MLQVPPFAHKANMPFAAVAEQISGMRGANATILSAVGASIFPCCSAMCGYWIPLGQILQDRQQLHALLLAQQDGAILELLDLVNPNHINKLKYHNVVVCYIAACHMLGIAKKTLYRVFHYSPRFVKNCESYKKNMKKCSKIQV